MIFPIDRVQSGEPVKLGFLEKEHDKVLQGCMRKDEKMLQVDGEMDLNQSVDRYVELTSALGVKKEKKLPTEDFELEVYQLINKEMDTILQSLKGAA